MFNKYSQYDSFFECIDICLDIAAMSDVNLTRKMLKLVAYGKMPINKIKYLQKLK